MKAKWLKMWAWCRWCNQCTDQKYKWGQWICDQCNDETGN